MALSGSVSTSSYEGRYYKLSWTAKPNVADNTSTISWTLEALGGTSSWYAERTLKVVIAGTTVYSKSDRVERYKGEIETGTKTITHNSDGTKSFSVSVQAAVYGTSVNCTGSKDFTLDPIARESTLSVSNGTLGTAQTLTISEQVAGFEHKLTYSCGTASGYILGSANGTSTSNSVSWTPPISLAAQNTTGKSVSIKFTLTTYKSGGETVVGSNTYTKTFTIPNKLSCSISVSDATGKSSTYGGYIKGVSKFKVDITPNTSNSYSPVSSYSTTANDATYTTASFTTDVLKKSGSLTISAKVTDKRGHSSTATKTVTVLDYTAPTVSKLTVLRCNSDGTTNTEGAYIKVTYSGAITSLSSKNTAKYQLKYKKTTETSYTTVNLSTAYTVTDGTKVFAADTASSYDVQIVATDAFRSTTRSTSASSGFTIMHFNADGNGMGLGKVCEFAGLDVGFISRFHKHLNVGNKTGYLDGKQGVHLNPDGYIHLQRTTGSPYIAFMFNDSKALQAVIRWNFANKIMEFIDSTEGYSFDGNTFVGETKAWEDGLAGTKLSPSGGLLIQRESGSSPYVDFRLYGTKDTYDGRIIYDRTDKYMGFRGASYYDFDAGIYSKKGLRLGTGDTSGKTQLDINTYWADKDRHNIITRGADGLTATFGWVGTVTNTNGTTSTYQTVTQLRGQTVKYQNSSGTTTLSDERLKKDFTDLSGWEAFFNSLEPCAFKMKGGASGRYHLGFKAQQVEKALIDNELSTMDFAGFVKAKYMLDEDDPVGSKVYAEAGINPGDDEFGLIYTEFTALNTYMIQKLLKENAELTKKVDDLEKRLGKLEALMKV